MFYGQTLFDQVGNVKRKLQKHIDQHQKAIIIEHNIYVPDNATKVIFTKLYPHFAFGYEIIKATGEKLPYSITYNSLICHDFDERSQWEDGSSLYD